MATSLPVDTNVKVPAAVLAAAQRASELLEAQNAPPVEEGQPEPEAGQPEPEAAPEPTTKSTEPAGDPPSFAEGGKAEPPADDNDQSWKQKFNSVNGRYTRAQEDLRRAGSQIGAMQRQIDELMSKVEALQSRPQEPGFERLVTEDEEKDYGADLLKVVGKRAREELLPEIAARDQEIEALKKRLDVVTNQAQTGTKAAMFAELDRAVPEWRQINQDQDFLDWLDQSDIYSGQQRRNMLTKAYNDFDAARVAAFFQGFLQEAAAVAPTSAQPEPAKQPTKLPLEQLAAPGRPKAAAPPSPADKPVITRQFIDKFYSDSTRGAYRGREAEYNRIEAMIFEAQQEGRVQ